MYIVGYPNIEVFGLTVVNERIPAYLIGTDNLDPIFTRNRTSTVLRLSELPPVDQDGCYKFYLVAGTRVSFADCTLVSSMQHEHTLAVSRLQRLNKPVIDNWMPLDTQCQYLYAGLPDVNSDTQPDGIVISFTDALPVDFELHQKCSLIFNDTKSTVVFNDLFLHTDGRCYLNARIIR